MLNIICGLPTRRYIDLRLASSVARPIPSMRERFLELQRLREQVRSAELRLSDRSDFLEPKSQTLR